MSYFVIESSADGIDITEHTQESLEAWLNDAKDEYAEGYIERAYHFLTVLERSDPNEWGYLSGRKPCTALIIKGEIVVPKAKERIKEWKL